VEAAGEPDGRGGDESW